MELCTSKALFLCSSITVFGDNYYVSGKSAGHVIATKRASSFIRPTSPKSPSASAFDSVEGSDDEDNMTDNSKIDTTYLHTNGNAVSSLSCFVAYS